MNVLVSGSRGFIGSALVARLTGEGHVVHRLARAGSTGDAHFVLDERRLDVAGLPGAGLADIDVVFHLAGEPITPFRWSAAKRERIRSSRVVTTDAVARSIAALEGPRPVLVAMSAIGYYGDRGEETLDETSTGGAGTLADICRAWEAATAPASDAGARVVNVRTGIVLGPGGGSLKIQLPLFKAALGGRLGSGRQWMSFIALRDEVAALCHAAVTDELHGPVNATAPTPVRNADFTAALGRAVHRPAVFAVPRTALELVLGAESTRETICASQRVLPAALERSGFAFTFPTVDAAIDAALAPAHPGPPSR